jgi:hypothetical protein
VPGAIGVGDTVIVTTAPAATTLRVTDPIGRQRDLDVTTGEPTVVRESGRNGVYTFTELTDADQVLAEYQIVVNAGSPAESNLRPNPDLASSLAGGDGADAMASGGGLRSDIWPLLAAIALIVIAAEWLVVRAQGATPVISRWRNRRLLHRGGAV